MLGGAWERQHHSQHSLSVTVRISVVNTIVQRIYHFLENPVHKTLMPQNENQGDKFNKNCLGRHGLIKPHVKHNLGIKSRVR